MAEYGLLIDYDWCTGCHTCEVACQMEHSFSPDRWGIKLTEVGPWEYEPETWQYTYMPVPTDQCDLCAKRTAEGKLPSCVHHCQAQCIKYGLLDELAKELPSKTKQTLYSLK